MATRMQWHGTRTEGLELVEVLSRYCSCVFSAKGLRVSVCAPHKMLCTDQRAIDGLLFSRRIAERLRNEEFQLHTAEAEVAASVA
jgi:hypothetical protein